MKRISFLLGFVLCSAIAAQAQSERLSSLSEQLATQASDASERSYNSFANSGVGSRADVETLFNAQQFSASANMFQRMVRDNRRESELRDAASLLSDLLRRVGTSYAGGVNWSSARRTLDDIQRELNVSGGVGGPRRDDFPGGRRDDLPGGQSGRLRWRGTVDDLVNLVIRDDRVEVRTIGGSVYSDATFNFTSPLPRRRNSINVVKINGRGDVRVLQQPTRDNDFTAVVEIKDSRGGAREYEIEVSW